jgi:hypothetical protein
LQASAEHVQPGVRENAGIAPVLVLPLEMEMVYFMGDLLSFLGVISFSFVPLL